MQKLPASWPAWDAPDAPAPTVYAVFQDSAWPPASDDCPVGTAKLSAWSIGRSLTGGLLPGQVRGATGMSIGRGALEFPQPDHDTIAPWRAGVHGVPTGELHGRVVAGYDGPAGDVIELAHFVTQARTGSLTGPVVHLDILEATGRLSRPLQVPRLLTDTYTSRIDPAYVIDTAARAIGRYSTPPPVASAVASVPLTGAAVSETGDVSSVIVGDWGSLEGQIVAEDATITVVAPTGADELYVTLTCTGTVNISARVVTGLPFDLAITVDPVAGTIKTGTGTIKNFIPGLNPNHPLRITVKVRVAAHASYTYVYASAKSCYEADFSGESYQYVSGTAIDPPVLLIQTAHAASGVQVSTRDDPNLWAHPTALIAPTGIGLDALLLDATSDAWGMIQKVVAATFGMAWLTETGVLMHRPREYANAARPMAPQIRALGHLEDLAWIIDPQDAADRVVVSWTPPVVQEVNDGSLTVWEATEVTKVDAGKTLDVVVDVEGTARDYASWQTPTGATIPDTGSQYFASTAAKDGTQVTSGVSVTTVVQSTTRVLLRIKNTTGSPVWMVDKSGSPTLILRANTLARAGEQQTLATGVDADAAANPLSIDLGPWCQNTDQAQEILDWVAAGATAAKWRLNDAGTVLHLGRQLGDLTPLTDEGTGLDTRTVVTGVSLQGSGGSISQTVSLAVLDDLQES